MRYVGALLLSVSIGATSCRSAAPPATTADAIRRLEARLAAIEATAGERQKLPPGPVAQRAISLRAGAEFLEKAEAARRKGDPGKAASLFQSAVDEVGADVLVDVEPLYRHVSYSEPPPVRHEPQVVEAAPPDPSPAPSVTPATVSVHAPSPHHERGSLLGSIKLDGPFAGDGGLGVVLLAPLGAKVTLHPRHAAVEQRKKDFTPHVLEVPTGSTVSFPNADPVFHNVFSLSDTRKFDLGLYKNGESKDVQFGRPGIVRLLCNLHAAMNAYVVVHDEPYAAVTDRGGRFHLKDLPPGRYRMRAWHERAKEVVTRDVEIEGNVTRISVPMKADLAPMLGPDKEGKPRGPQTPHS